MANLSTYDVQSGKAGEKDFSADLGEKILYRTLKDMIVQYQANNRQGDAHTKIRTELARAKQKPWKQKKTGRARAGDRRSPLWVGGATVFGPRNKRNWGFHYPRKQRLVALRSALMGKLQDSEVFELTSFDFEAPSSKQARGIMSGCGCGKDSVLVVTANRDMAVYKSFRNFPRVQVVTAAEANAYDLLAHKWILAQDGALEGIVARFSKISKEVR
ncbi:MAG: 50S ribosomal protein L4 [Planctomycetes bacterium]|jgi:large subunit ribosomal protein L4|nr:50S ribosomal protein L4 [Planctomycetota bacterium]MBT4028260.1 50S ribosomal protein L4 [Planctomycetota bacterium]MBT4560947.1 50S ribosomal protein L4 [Planctomycetota bacterium]MBT5101322.1 50S ribosomal protein L4 [Planctomycetota bacterium]MBT5120686.1 50S ribosomal protein L4 [Planctomycetota bacterium]